MKIRIILPLICFLSLIHFSNRDTLAAPPAQTPDCGCDHTVPLDRWKTDGVDDGIQPGDVVCLGSGTRGNMRLEDLTGTAENPIVIRNCGGQLIIDTTTYGISVANSKHIRLTGSGSPDYKYGIDVGGAVGVGELSTNVEVDHLDVHDASFAGFLVKTDPSCDPATWRENFTMYDVSLHDNYVHHTGDGEGFYVGYTFYDGVEKTCDGDTITVYGHVIEGLELYNNITEDTGAEGIQISSTPAGAQVYNNTVIKYGQRPFANYQDNGVQLSEGSIWFYNNLIDEGAGNGLIIFGTDHRVFNNVIVDAGAYGVFADDRRVGAGHAYLNNTIINPALDGIRIYNDESTLANLIKNNIIVNPGTGVFVHKLNDSVILDQSHNLFEMDIETVQFLNPAGGDYRLRAGSPAVNTGTDVAALGVTMDHNGLSRPQDGVYDLGAYEYAPTLNAYGSTADQTLRLTWHVDTILPVTGTWRIEYDGPAGDQPSPITGLISPTRAYTLTGLTNYTLYTVTLKAMLADTPFLTDTILAMPTDIFVHLPLVLKE